MRNPSRKILFVTLAALSLSTTLLMLRSAPIALASANVAQASVFQLDPVHSHVAFNVGHMGVGTSWGVIKDPTGSFTLSPDSIVLTIELDINKIDSANAKRDEHLRGPDFFNAAQFPKATFKSTSSKTLAEGSFEVTGDFTIRDVTKPITLTLKKVGEKDLGERFGYRAGFDTQFTINRLDYGVSYMPEGLGKDVTIMVSIEGKRD